ncbi:hypothetical protein [Ideonella oryzae]|nr:hypothetical protein [Ideonella oryzae]
MTPSDTSWRFSPASADDGLDTQVSPSNAPPDLQQAFDDWMANTQGQGQAPRLADVLATQPSPVGNGDETAG